MVADKSGKRTYLRAPDRERAIIEAATLFFAERGFDGQTRELAQAMGITHSAIFRYFPTKDALIDRVYEHVYLSRWNPDWDALVTDRTHPLVERLTRFYVEYAERIFHYDWVRIFVFAGMRQVSITDRYLAVVRSSLIVPVCHEIRFARGLPTVANDDLAREEEETVWGLHGQVFYIAIRKFIYNQPISDDWNPIIANHVRVFMRGIGLPAA